MILLFFLEKGGSRRDGTSLLGFVNPFRCKILVSGLGLGEPAPRRDVG